MKTALENSRAQNALPPDAALASGPQRATSKPIPTLAVYDPPMCCSTGICGPEVDPKLVQFAADLGWLAGQGVKVERFNLAQSPLAFAENELVRAALTENGEAALPLVIAAGHVVAKGGYPDRTALAAWVGLEVAQAGGATRP